MIRRLNSKMGSAAECSDGGIRERSVSRPTQRYDPLERMEETSCCRVIGQRYSNFPFFHLGSYGPGGLITLIKLIDHLSIALVVAVLAHLSRGLDLIDEDTKTDDATDIVLQHLFGYL